MPLFAVVMLLQASTVATPARRGGEIASATQPLSLGGDPNEVVCKPDVRSGSRILIPSCHTREQWLELARAVQLRNDTTRPTACTGVNDKYC